MRLMGPELATVPWIAAVSVITLVLVAFAALAARRRGNYASAAMAVLAAADAGIALAACFAVWTFSRTLTELASLGGGIDTLSYWIWQSARLPLSAAWVALIAGRAAIILVILATRSETTARSSGSFWTPALALCAGVGAVLFFRDAMAFVVDVVLGGRRASAGDVESKLLVAGAGSALCFLVTLMLVVMTLRHGGGASFQMSILVIVLSLAASAMLISDLDDYASCWQKIHRPGRGDRIGDLVRQCPSAGLSQRLEVFARKE